MDEEFLEAEEHGFSQDQRAELGLGALVCVVVLVLLAMLAFILKEAWPSFAHNGLHWFGPAAPSTTRSRRSSPPGTRIRRRSCCSTPGR